VIIEADDPAMSSASTPPPPQHRPRVIDVDQVAELRIVDRRSRDAQ